MMTRRRLAFLAVIVAIGIVIGWRAIEGSAPARAAAPASPSQEPSEVQVPVTTAPAQVRDVPVLLDGLGTVQALSVVEIKAQANGTLVALPAREGQEVHKGDIVAEIDPRPYKAALDQAMAQRAEDAALLRSAQLDLQRFQSLAERNDAPIQQVDDQLAIVDKEKAAIAADSAMIETAQINIGYCVIRAPINGRVSLYQVDAGNLIEVASQTGIVSITQDRPIAVVLTLPEADLARVQAARNTGSVPVEVVGSDDAQTVLARGTLLTPNNTIDTTTGTISLKAIFPNQDDHLWPGEFVNTRVQVDVLHKAITTPVDAIQHGPNGLFVFVVKPDQTVAQVNVQVGYQDGDMAVVTKGLSGNQTVVVSGQSRLAPGTRVRATDVARAGQPPPPAAADGRASSG